LIVTTKQAIYRKVEQIDEERAKLILTYIEDLLSDPDNNGRRVEAEHIQANFEPSAERQTSEREAMLSLIGMARSALPTNIAEHKDEYIVDAILHRDKTNS